MCAKYSKQFVLVLKLSGRMRTFIDNLFCSLVFSNNYILNKEMDRNRYLLTLDFIF